MRVRARYRKTGPLRFISAIDVGRLWERALRRADLPIAYSEGFSPHPKVSFTDALPLGYASVAEYAELTFAGPLDLERAIVALNGAFAALAAGKGPAGAVAPGVAVEHAVVVVDGDPRLAKWLRASCWDVDYAATAGLDEAVTAVSTADELPVARERKGETQTVDLRPALHHLSTDGVRVRAILHHAEHLPPGSVAVRPSEVDLALRQLLPGLPAPALTTRVAQGRPTDAGLDEALSGAHYAALDHDQRQPT